MKVKIWFNKEEDVFLTEAQMNERKKELAEEMTNYPRDYDEIATAIDNMDLMELWESFTPEAKKAIVDKAVESWYADSDYFCEGEIEI